MKPSVYALARALERQHGFHCDVAFMSAWYGSGRTGIPEVTYAQMVSRMAAVRRVPALTEEEAERMRAAYRQHQLHGRCTACVDLATQEREIQSPIVGAARGGRRPV
jgi:hypothetical protein